MIMKTFSIPIIYQSPLITAVKNMRKKQDKMKKDFLPYLLDFGELQIYLSRHFGFCYGVENAIEIAFHIIEENPGKRIFLLSEMIHNPHVNASLRERGVRFLQDTQGRQLIGFEELSPKDIVITPAFGTTVEIENHLKTIGITPEKYKTTCPFVEKVWNRSEQIATGEYTVVVHGKPLHEETRATFSHAASHAPTVIVKNMAEAVELSKYITREKSATEFYSAFKGRYSPGFEVEKDLQRIGVVNQTTMLATDTQAIADFLKQTMINHYHLTEDRIEEHFADTRDTLCYATRDNQSAVIAMLEWDADLAIVVGGYNSSNTSHLAELFEKKLATYFIDSAEKLLSSREIVHHNIHDKKELLTKDYFPPHKPVRIFITSGASCPDATVENVIRKLVSFFPVSTTLEEMAALLTAS
jgi:4-hydroxy-3-methylbut-2-enyl diphosphate reductase